MTMADLGTILLSETVVSSAGTFRWMSPELMDLQPGSKGRLTCESDCYALGMVIYEVSWLNLPRWPPTYPSQVLTGLQPFHRLYGYGAVAAVLRGERPERPLSAESLGFSHTLWWLVQSSWSKTISIRPTAQQLHDHLSSASLTWDPPRMYPVVGIDAETITGSDLSDFLETSTTNFMGDV